MVWYVVPSKVSVRYFQSTISNNPVLSFFSQTMGADDAVIGLIAPVSPLVTVIIITAAGCKTGGDSFRPVQSLLLL